MSYFYDETTKQLIDAFCRRQEALLSQHLQDLEVLTSIALTRSSGVLDHRSPLPKRVFGRIRGIGKWLGSRLLYYKRSLHPEPSQPALGQPGPEPDYASPIVIDGSYRVLPPRQEGEP